ncbi:MAG TPA: hypothetical protein VK774_04415, partial [Solirubrobacteraceae bacterium]|nr:hypothetical protein [Solirubrobacteraceae bacterium]
HHGHISTNVATRNVAKVERVSRAGSGALITLTLELDPRYRSLASRRPGLPGTVSVSFAAVHHPTLHAGTGVSFLRTAKPTKKKGKKASVKGGSQRVAKTGGRSR